MAGTTAWVRAANRPPKSPEVIWLLIGLLALLVVDTSNCEALNWLGMVVSAVVVVFNTKGWPLPTKTSTAPDFSVVVEMPTNLDRFDTSWSRWSIKSLGGWPPASAVPTATCWFRLAMDLASELICVTSAVMPALMFVFRPCNWLLVD